MRSLTLLTLLSTLPLLTLAARGGSKHTPEIPADDWATMHLHEEHHIDNFDPGAMFMLHDFDEDGFWTPDEVRRMYGLEDVSLKDVSESKKEEVTRGVFGVFDTDKNGRIDREEWLRATHRGDRLPDFGLGPGHHGDDEYEYEIHHFEKFHGPDTTEEDLIHPEDIAHFAKHDKEDEEAEIWEQLYQKPIIEKNIPAMFRRKQ